MSDARFQVVRNHLNVVNVVIVKFLLFGVQSDGLSGLVCGLFETVCFILLEAKSSLLSVDLRVD